MVLLRFDVFVGSGVSHLPIDSQFGLRSDKVAGVAMAIVPNHHRLWKLHSGSWPTLVFLQTFRP